MTTELSSLQISLGVLIGDSNDTYSSNYTKAINNASKEIINILFIPLDNMDLITGNLMPAFNWATSSALDFYTEPTGTFAENTSGEFIWNGSSSAKITGSGANDKLLLSSNDYPRLLDVMNKSVDLKCWVYPVDAAADAFLDIKTWQKDGTTQSLPSTTTTYPGKKCLIELEDQAIDDDIEKIEIWMRVLTSTQNVYFDMPRLIGPTVREYLLPKDFQGGYLSSVEVQSWGDADDLHSPRWRTVYDTEIITDGAYKYLRLPPNLTSERRIRLRGYKALEQLSSGSDTISIEEGQVNLLLHYAAFKLFEIENQEIQYTIDNFTNAITAIDLEIDTPVGSIGALKTTIATADSALSDITVAIATATTAVNGVAADIAALQTTIDSALTAIAAVSSEDISRYEKVIARNQGQITRDEERRVELKAIRDNLMVKRDAKDADIRRLDDQRKRLDDEIARFEAERIRIHQKRSESKSVMARLKERSLEWLAKYHRLLPGLQMTQPPMPMRLGW